MVQTEIENFSFFDPAYQGREHNLHFSLSVSKGGLFWTWFDIEQKIYLDCGQSAWNNLSDLKSLINQLSHLYSSCKSKSLSFQNPLFTLVPKALYRSEKALDFLSFNHSFSERETEVLTSEIERQNAYCVYGLHAESLQMILQAFPGITINHLSKTLLEAFAQENSGAGSKMFAYLNSGEFYLSFFKSEKLIFHNSFKYQSAEDFIYFLLYVMEQLDLNREETALALCGEIEENSAIYKLAYTYIREITILGRPKQVNYAAKLSHLAQSYNYALYNQYLCE